MTSSATWAASSLINTVNATDFGVVNALVLVVCCCWPLFILLPIQRLQVNSHSVLIIPRNERRSWGAKGEEEHKSFQREKQRNEGAKHLSEKEKQRECLLCRERCLELRARPPLQVKGPHCVWWVPLLQLIFTVGQGPHFYWGNWWAKPGGVGDVHGILLPQTVLLTNMSVCD